MFEGCWLCSDLFTRVLRSESGYIAPKPPNRKFSGAGYRYQRRGTGTTSRNREGCYRVWALRGRVPVLHRPSTGIGPGTGASRRYRYLAVCLHDRGLGLRDLLRGISTPAHVSVNSTVRRLHVLAGSFWNCCNSLYNPTPFARALLCCHQRRREVIISSISL